MSSTESTPLLPTTISNPVSQLQQEEPSFPYRLTDWRAVDDRIRGGSSVSHLEPYRPAHAEKEQSTGLRFWGILDTQTLGGAGFASQCHDFPLSHPLSFPTSHFSGLDLTILPHHSHLIPSPTTTESEKTENRPGAVSVLTLVVKTEFPARRPDGRNEAGVNWEVQVDFSNVSPVGAVRSSSGLQELHHYPFSTFTPTSKGRPLPRSDLPPLDPSHIVSISLMARSNFGRQEGPFDFIVLDLQGKRNNSSGGFLGRMGEKIWRWFQMTYVGRWLVSSTTSMMNRGSVSR